MTFPTISSAPTAPNRATDTPAQFSSNADAFVAWLETFSDELNTFSEALVDAGATANYSASSVTSVAIGTGSKSFTVEAGKLFVGGQFLLIADAADPTTNYMYGSVTSYNITTGALVFNSLRVGGSGTKAAWFIGLCGIQGTGGDTLPSFAGNAGKSLRVNTGETASEWVEEGYVLIETLSPSGAATSTSAAIPATYSDLMVRHSGSITSGLGVAVSSDGTTFSSAKVFFSAVTATVATTFRINGYNYDDGMIAATSTSSSSPGIGNTAGEAYGWVSTGGIEKLRFANGSGNLTGTIRIYGKK